MKDLIHRYKQWLWKFRVERGKGQYGRQTVSVPLKGTISARVIRADGTVEELGVIARAEGSIDRPDVVE